MSCPQNPVGIAGEGGHDRGLAVRRQHHHGRVTLAAGGEADRHSACGCIAFHRSGRVACSLSPQGAMSTKLALGERVEGCEDWPGFCGATRRGARRP